MSMIQCMIIDDEPFARDILLTYANNLPYLQIVNSSSNALQARAYLEENHVDLLFLDINMPILDGMKFLNTLKSPPLVIFTTAYQEHAVEAFNADACDYLLKPFSFERFLVAIDKAKAKLNSAGVKPIANTGKDEASIFIRTEGKIYKLDYQELLYIEASGNYVRVATIGQVLVVKITFAEIMQQLNAPIFKQVHRSFLINTNKIAHISGNRITIAKTEIPIGENYRKKFFAELGFKQ